MFINLAFTNKSLLFVTLFQVILFVLQNILHFVRGKKRLVIVFSLFIGRSFILMHMFFTIIISISTTDTMVECTYIGSLSPVMNQL